MKKLQWQPFSRAALDDYPKGTILLCRSGCKQLRVVELLGHNEYGTYAKQIEPRSRWGALELNRLHGMEFIILTPAIMPGQTLKEDLL